MARSDQIRVGIVLDPAVQQAVRSGDLKARRLTAERNSAERDRDEALMALDHCREALEDIAAGNPQPQIRAEATLRELDGDLTSFRALVAIAQRMLDRNYPAEMFKDTSLGAGAEFVSQLRAALGRVHGRRDV